MSRTTMVLVSHDGGLLEFDGFAQGSEVCQVVRMDGRNLVQATACEDEQRGMGIVPVSRSLEARFEFWHFQRFPDGGLENGFVAVYLES